MHWVNQIPQVNLTLECPSVLYIYEETKATKKNLHTLRRTLSLDASDDGRNDDLVDLWHPYWRREQPYDTNRWEHDVDDDKANDNWNDDDHELKSEMHSLAFDRRKYVTEQIGYVNVS
uniref:Uncharacterized protein n=1 Tax=Glossina pallidipes TaxID=7398 RepID=A0A1B0A1J1_GLOPL